MAGAPCLKPWDERAGPTGPGVCCPNFSGAAMLLSLCSVRVVRTGSQR